MNQDKPEPTEVIYIPEDGGPVTVRYMYPGEDLPLPPVLTRQQRRRQEREARKRKG